MNTTNQILPNGLLNTDLIDFTFDFETMEMMYDLIHQFINYNPYPELKMIIHTDGDGDDTGCFYNVCKQFEGNTESHFISFLFNYDEGIKDFLNYANVVRPRNVAIDEILTDLENNPIK